MAISFNEQTKTFILDTKNTRYSFAVMFDNYPVHLYYGKKDEGVEAVFEKKYRSFSPYIESIGTTYSPDTTALEYSTFGDGDFRATALRIKNGDGNSVTSLVYKSHRIFEGRLDLERLPFADADDDTHTLELTMEDIVTDVEVKLYYTVFENEDIISRYAVVTNRGKSDVTIEKCMSLMLDLPDCDYDMISLYGGHVNERNVQRRPLFHGMQSVCSRRGASSHQFNPFIALCRKETTHDSGEVYGFNFVYSGNFLDEVEVDQCEATRVLIGLGGENFNYLLKPEEKFILFEI